MARSETEQLYLSILAGGICALGAYLFRCWWKRRQKPFEIKLEKQRFQDTDWVNLSDEQMEKEVLQLILSQPGLAFGYAEDPWLKERGTKQDANQSEYIYLLSRRLKLGESFGIYNLSSTKVQDEADLEQQTAKKANISSQTRQRILSTAVKNINGLKGVEKELSDKTTN